MVEITRRNFLKYAPLTAFAPQIIEAAEKPSPSQRERISKLMREKSAIIAYNPSPKDQMTWNYSPSRINPDKILDKREVPQKKLDEIERRLNNLDGNATSNLLYVWENNEF